MMKQALRCLAGVGLLLGLTAPLCAQNEITLVYDQADGNMLMQTNGLSVTTLEIKSASGVFTGTKPDLVLPPFDVFTPEKFFILKTDGIGETDFGPIAASGLTIPFLTEDLSISGSVLPSGGLTGTVVAVPEPAGIGLALLGMFGLLAARRR